jgi:type IV pilus assembly protein PilA
MVQMKKLNNKGFSLVELIIVIAIMAILVGVVGTQVIPYLENSRKAKDQQVISSWNTAAMSAYSNAAAKVNAKTNYKITITAGDPCSVKVTPDGDAGSTSIENYFKELTNIEKFKISSMESKAGKAVTKVVIDITADGDITTTTSCSDGYNFDVIEN